MKRSPRWAFFSRFDITNPVTGEVYLRRWYLLATPWFSILLHKINTPDEDRDLHDHPWAFLSIILRGGYDELVLDSWKMVSTHRRRWFSFKRSTDAHRIVTLHRTPTWTLVFTGPRCRTWGFYTSGGWVDWKTYLGVGSTFDLVAHLRRQAEFSDRTFGPGERRLGVVNHIRKELCEVECAGAGSEALAEWIDVAILAFDGAWRCGATPEQIVAALVAKQTKNEGRRWPDWRTFDEGEAIEHDRAEER